MLVQLVMDLNNPHSDFCCKIYRDQEAEIQLKKKRLKIGYVITNNQWFQAVKEQAVDGDLEFTISDLVMCYEKHSTHT